MVLTAEALVGVADVVVVVGVDVDVMMGVMIAQAIDLVSSNYCHRYSNLVD